eukprot:s2524_g11.t1
MGTAVCRTASQRKLCIHRFLLFILWFGHLRIGEALNPGPEPVDMGAFSLGTFNPSGLRNKANYVHSEVPAGDLRAISETHFFGRDLQRFRAGLRFAKSDYKYCVVDQPSLKPTILQKDSWKGVAVLSPHPTRHVPSSLPFEIVNSSRAIITTSLIRDAWVTGATLYGEPDGHLYPARVEHNAALLHHAACQICHLQTGLRFVAGDLNMSPDDVPAFDILRGAGFKDVQDLAEEIWGVAIQPTCKGKTRKDYLFISPELQCLLTEVRVLQDIWPDHAVLLASFQSARNLPKRMAWPAPGEFPWPKDFACSFQWQLDHPDPSSHYSAMWAAIESQAAQQCPVPVTTRMKGCAQQCAPKPVSRLSHPPGKAGRPGDFQPDFHGVSFRHGQWIRQVRRLQNYVRSVRHDANEGTHHQLSLWGSILRAKGFAPDFPTWWSSISTRVPGCPVQCPQCPPSLAVADAMFDSLTQTVRHLEGQMKQASRQYAKVRRETDPNLVFQDLRAQPNQGVELLAQSRQATITEVRLDESALVLSDSLQWCLDKPIFCSGQPVPVVHAEADCLWVDDTSPFEVGMRVSQTKWIGCHDEIAAEFLEAWRSRWMRHAEVPDERWQVIIDFARSHLPRNQFSWGSLDSSGLASVIASKHARSAPGFDGVTLRDLKLMPPAVLTQFCQVFQTAETHGRWPQQMIDGRVTSLAKHAQPGSAMDFRPITIFGLLYRLVVFEACGLLGVPFYVLHAWAAAVSQMQRRFVLRENISDPVSSCTGFAEGDGLSCLAMIAVDSLFHAWYAVFFPLGQPLTYVDDWQVLCSDPSRIEAMKSCLDQFVASVDLTLDNNKTYVWALDSDSRQQMRTAGFTVLLGARNLGAQVQMSRKHLNSVQMQRIESLQPLWPRLRLSLCPYHVKVRALRAAAWPKGLHAVAATAIGDQTFQSLRSGAMKGLSADGAGCNPVLHLGLVEDPNTDPLFWTCIKTFRSARDCGQEHAVTEALLALVSGASTIPANGINAILLSRLQVFDWHVLPDGNIGDVFGRFSLFSVSMPELVWRATWAWKQWVQSAVNHRPGLTEISRVDPSATRQWLSKLSASDRALARKLLNGAHITQDCKVHCQEDGSNLCPFCSCTDSRYHRFWQCEYFASQRPRVDPSILKLAPNLPEAVVSYGWSLLAHTSLGWWQYLATIECPACQPCISAECVHFFTDGSCMFPHDPDLRLASWAVVTGTPCPVNAASRVVATGPLPGLLQTSYRAETFAILQALRSAATSCQRVMLWTDCEAVVKRLRRCLRGLPPKINAPNSDIWLDIFAVLQSWPTGAVQVTHVSSHMPIHAASNMLEEWCFFHNALADHAATVANRSRGPAFWHFFDDHVCAVQHARFISTQVQSNLLAISQAVVQAESLNDEQVELQGFCEPSRVPEGAWSGLQGNFHTPPAAVRWYGDLLVRKLLSWFWFTVDQSAEVVWVSQFQLYIDYMLSTGEIGPVHFDRWADGGDNSALSLVNITFKVRCRWFSKVLKESLRHQQQTVKHSFCRPHSTSLSLHTGCLAIPWPSDRLTRIDEWILQHIPGGVRRTAKALDSLPVALVEPKMMFFTSLG